MNRKFFLGALLPTAWLVTNLSSSTKASILPVTNHKYKIPAYLQAGDKIGITCPAGAITVEEIMPAVEQMKSWGFEPIIGKTVGLHDFTFGGTDEQRLSDLQEMLDDPTIKAIMCARGGYGVVRIIDKLNFTAFKKQPKWLIGFSDITVLHSHLNNRLRVASIHSKMCNSFPSDWNSADDVQRETILSIEKALKGEKPMQYQADYHPENKLGRAEGILLGGNLRCLENLAATQSALQAKAKILFLEDVSEPLYNIDRMFYNLLRTGVLASINGLIIGGFRIKKDDPGDEFGKTIEQIVMEKVAGFGYPVCFGFPVGHQKANFALKLGLPHRLSVNYGASKLEELI
jgi:muramoyltetrapeptide carboxypeptidase